MRIIVARTHINGKNIPWNATRYDMKYLLSRCTEKFGNLLWIDWTTIWVAKSKSNSDFMPKCRLRSNLKTLSLILLQDYLIISLLCFHFSMRTATEHLHVPKIEKFTSDHTLGKNLLAVNTQLNSTVVKNSPTLRIAQNMSRPTKTL